MTSDTVVYIGSLSKVLTAILTLQLVEKHELRLDAALADVSVDAPGDVAMIRISHLLTHSSGLEREGDFNYWYTADFPDTQALREYLHRTKLRAMPGTVLHYSNVGYAVLGLVIEQTTGESYAAVLRERVLEPLQMKRTGIQEPAEDVANGYTPNGRMLPDASRPFAGIGQRVGDRYVRMYHDARAMSPAFGTYSSARDLGRLAMFLLGHAGNEVLSREMRVRMRERQASGWGLGLKLQRLGDRTVARHDGWFAAHRAHLLLDVGDRIGIVVLTNSDSATPRRIAEALHEAVVGVSSP